MEPLTNSVSRSNSSSDDVATDSPIATTTTTTSQSEAMLLASDLSLNTTKFLPSSISPETVVFNRKLQEIERSSEKWYDAGASRYRLMRKQGLTALPGVVLLPSATTYPIPSRDKDRSIPCRVLKPQDSESHRGIFLHFHGGGWVLNDEQSSDLYLQRIADSCQLLCISVGYRLAPEDPYPAAPQDCLDVAQWLIDHGPMKFGLPLSWVGGESAGANLALLTTLSLLQSPVERYANVRFNGLLLHYGTYAMHWNPGTRHFKRCPTLVLDEESLTHFRDAYLPDLGLDTLTSPQVSPFYADLGNLPLPPVMFTCGTEDCLLEDSVFMSVRWLIAGGQAILKLYPGSPHGFVLFSPELHDNAVIVLRDIQSFVDMTSP